jgi:hypothetical protein
VKPPIGKIDLRNSKPAHPAPASAILPNGPVFGASHPHSAPKSMTKGVSTMRSTPHAIQPAMLIQDRRLPKNPSPNSPHASAPRTGPMARVRTRVGANATHAIQEMLG